MKLKTEIRARDAVMACFPEASVGCEIGVHLGIHARELLLAVRPAMLHLIDPWQAVADSAHAGSWYDNVDQEEMDRYCLAVSESLEEQIRGGSVKIHRKTSAAAMPGFADNSLDWVYVDGDHSHAAVTLDLALSYAKTKPGGFIAGDDYQRDGWWGDGILRAVHHFLATKPVKMHLVMDDQFVIEKLA